MPSWRESSPPMRAEAHFGDRIVRCFAERPRDVDALFAEAVSRNGDGEALVDGAERLAWRELEDIVARAAAGFARRGVGRGDRVALLLGNRKEFVIAWLATARLGAIVVPLSIRAQAPELAYMLAQCEASAIVHEAELADRLPAPSDAPALRTRLAVGECAGSEPFAALI
ncbi:MAG: AMP-binding protein, partial [Burkholderiaceae bacterium]|nr:AMP-binding protein [Burkholderiaceae bacterium]